MGWKWLENIDDSSCTHSFSPMKCCFDVRSPIPPIFWAIVCFWQNYKMTRPTRLLSQTFFYFFLYITKQCRMGMRGKDHGPRLKPLCNRPKTETKNCHTQFCFKQACFSYVPRWGRRRCRPQKTRLWRETCPQPSLSKSCASCLSRGSSCERRSTLIAFPCCWRFNTHAHCTELTSHVL